MVTNLCFHCRHHRFDPWSGNYPACHVVKKQTTNAPTPQNISPKGNQESTHPASYHTDVDTEPGRSASRPRSAKSEGQSQPSSQGAMPQPPPRPGCLPPLLQACSRVSGCQPKRLSQSCSPWKTVWLYSETPTISTMDGDEASRAPGRRALRRMEGADTAWHGSRGDWSGARYHSSVGRSPQTQQSVHRA